MARKMLGIVLHARVTNTQNYLLSCWMGCARFIWNAKCDEEKYHAKFARNYLPIGTYPKVDQSYSPYKSKELSPWLFDCPSQILRNSTSNWHATYKKFLKGECGKPKRKKKRDGGSIHLTRELFSFEKCEDGVTRLFIGTKKFPIGYISLKNHRKYKIPNSLYIKQQCGKFTVSFCYEEASIANSTNEEHLKYLSGFTKEELDKITVGIDRGVKRPVQAGCEVFDFSNDSEKSKQRELTKIRQRQKALARSQKNSKRRKKKRRSLSKAFEKIKNIRKDFCHKTSRKLVDNENYKIFVLEDLKTSNMTKAPRSKVTKEGRFEKNGAKRKAGFNKAILDKGWHKFESYLRYKSMKAGKAFFKVPAYHTSQECAACGHTHPNNRQSQSEFSCEDCGHTDHADHNAAEVIKMRAIKLILDSGTELSKRGVLLDRGRGAIHKTRGAIAIRARSNEASKKKVLAQVA